MCSNGTLLGGGAADALSSCLLVCTETMRPSQPCVPAYNAHTHDRSSAVNVMKLSNYAGECVCRKCVNSVPCNSFTLCGIHWSEMYAIIGGDASGGEPSLCSRNKRVTYSLSGCIQNSLTKLRKQFSYEILLYSPRRRRHAVCLIYGRATYTISLARSPSLCRVCVCKVL